jgi:two-component system CheB/CheR fusion protein
MQEPVGRGAATTGSESTPGIFPIVGIGASAGGLAAFEAFFSGMPADGSPGMAFVLVQHLAPDHKSLLTDLIQRRTRMQVFEVEDGMVVQVNCAYIIPPGRDMAFLNGTLHLLEPAKPRGQRLPIDFFFRSLAQDQHERAIGIVLSGTGSDGAQGVRAIKAEGGMVMAQNIASTEFDGMPRSAIATGLVDFELLPADMPAQLIAYTAHTLRKPSQSADAPQPRGDSAMKRVFVLLRSQTGHDFSLYKPGTINRRVERRMAVHRIEKIDDYVRYLQQTPAEVEALFRDLLIGVTSFFRDPDAFAVLQELVIPQLFARKPHGAPLRVWTAGCSTGEEAYSIAMLLVEHMEAQQSSRALQLFASDIDPQAIATARVGLYPASIAADVTPERLARFFTLEPDGNAYRIRKGIRDLLVFSEHDVIKDPPFSRLDMITCRNVLIYMGAELQKRLIPLFHYALRPDGWLFLGASSGVGEFDALFAVLDRKAKLYQRKEDLLGQRRKQPGRFLPPLTGMPTAVDAPDALQGTAAAHGASRAKTSPGRSLREITEQALLAQIIAAGALVNSMGDILYLHGRSGLFLEPSPGEAGINNILKMAREGLGSALTHSLQTAAGTRETVLCAGLRVKTNGHFTTVNLTVRPVVEGGGATSEVPLYLVVLEEAFPAMRPEIAAVDGGSLGASALVAPDIDARIAALRAELRTKEDYLQSANEELESSAEELKSSNEEMQSVNEELQSTNEELETSKEELQSVNEELATVNTELQTKVTDLSRANNDMNNLLAGTGVGTVFVDHQLRILRFTPAVSAIINLIPTDIGRPVSHIVSNLSGYGALVADVQMVLRTLVPKEVEVGTHDGQKYTLRIQPYRTLDNVIEGAVISFIDITEMKKSQDALHRTSALLARTGELARVGGWDLDLRGMTLNWAPETFQIHELDPSEAPTLEQAVAFYEPEARAAVQGAIQAAIDHGIPWLFEQPLVTAKGRHIWVRAQGVAEMQGVKAVRLFGAVQDITERKQVEESLRKANDLLRLAVVVRDAHDAITVQDLAGRTLAWNAGAQRLYGWTEAEALALNVRDRIPEPLREAALATLAQLSRAEVLESYRTQRLTRQGQVLEVSIISTALIDKAGQMYAIATTERARVEGKA